MLRQRMRAVLGTWRGRLGAALVVLVILVGSGYAVATRGSQSMEIVVQTSFTSFLGGQPYAPDVTTVFDKKMTDQKLVMDTKRQLDGLPRGVSGGCIIEPPGEKQYSYEFTFAISGVPIETYSGTADCAMWTVTTLLFPHSVADADNTGLYGYNLMTTLRKLTGMPLPSWWSATLPTS
jgi:hypothetical protein